MKLFFYISTLYFKVLLVLDTIRLGGPLKLTKYVRQFPYSLVRATMAQTYNK
jgi:hypothetical protein